MEDFIKKMLCLGGELQKADDGFHCSMIINDAEILYKKEFKSFNFPVVSGSPNDFEKELFNLVNNYCNKGLKKSDLVKKIEWVLGSCKVS